MSTESLKLLGSLNETYRSQDGSKLNLIHKQIIGLLFARWLERAELGSPRPNPTRNDLKHLLGDHVSSFDVRCAEALRPLKSNEMGIQPRDKRVGVVLAEGSRGGQLDCNFSNAHSVDAVQLLNASKRDLFYDDISILKGYEGHLDRLFEIGNLDKLTSKKLLTFIKPATWRLWLAYLAVAQKCWDLATQDEKLTLHARCQELFAGMIQSLELAEAEISRELMDRMHPTRIGSLGPWNLDPSVALEIARVDLLRGRPDLVTPLLVSLEKGSASSGPRTACDYLLVKAAMLGYQGSHRYAIEANSEALEFAIQSQDRRAENYCRLALAAARIKRGEHALNHDQKQHAMDELGLASKALATLTPNLSAPDERLRHATLTLQITYLNARTTGKLLHWPDLRREVDELTKLADQIRDELSSDISLEVRSWVAASYNTLGNVAYYACDWKVANHHYSLALREFHAMSAPRQMGSAAINVACCEARNGKLLITLNWHSCASSWQRCLRTRRSKS